jgi:hypothetical protein
MRGIASAFHFYFYADYGVLFVSHTFLCNMVRIEMMIIRSDAYLGAMLKQLFVPSQKSKEKKAMLFTRKKRTFYRVKKIFFLNKNKFKSINFYQLAFFLTCLTG